MTRSADTFPGDISGVRIFWAIVAAPVVEFVCSTLCAMAVGIMVFGYFFYYRTTMPEMSQQPEPDSNSLLIAEYALTGLVTFSSFLGGFVCASISRQPTVLYPFLGDVDVHHLVRHQSMPRNQ